MTRTNEQNREYLRNHLQKWRLAAVEIYGGKCACCGEDESDFLTFDHVNGDGNSERARKAYKGSWYRHLALSPRRIDLQLLCANCNVGKERPGGCPHKRITKQILTDAAACD